MHGELDRITKQVCEELPQAPRIPYQQVGHSPLYVPAQLDALCNSFVFERLAQLIREIPEEELQTLQFNFTGLDRGKIEKIVD